MDKHYVCPQCAAESPVPKNCVTEDCLLKDKRLEECLCQDGTHTMALNEND
jgi:hypothetical protein